MYRVLIFGNETRTRLPVSNNMSHFKQAFAIKHSMLTDVYCVFDGLKIKLCSKEDAFIQNKFYHRWTQNHYVANVFDFATNEKIVACEVYASGSFHDSTIAG